MLLISDGQSATSLVKLSSGQAETGGITGSKCAGCTTSSTGLSKDERDAEEDEHEQSQDRDDKHRDDLGHVHLALQSSKSFSASVSTSRNGSPGRPPTLARNMPRPGGAASWSLSHDGGDTHDVTSARSRRDKPTIEPSGPISASGRPPITTRPARSTRPRAFWRSSSSGKACRSARVWLTDTVATPRVRFSRDSVSTRST